MLGGRSYAALFCALLSNPLLSSVSSSVVLLCDCDFLPICLRLACDTGVALTSSGDGEADDDVQVDSGAVVARLGMKALASKWLTSAYCHPDAER